MTGNKVPIIPAGSKRGKRKASRPPIIRSAVKAGTPGLRSVPDALRLALDRRGMIPETLDLDQVGEAACSGLKCGTSAVRAMQEEVSGKVSAYDTALVRDTLYFRNMVYPHLFVDGAFDAADLMDSLGSLDGRHGPEIFLRVRTGSRRFDPDSLRVRPGVP